ncbi:MAG TPA: spherulation-specific family 4 protein [Ilumatobacteraceae bacterium]|nr:spherulation-specific family 4 protein [Ilumatobacteraceae bacterium]
MTLLTATTVMVGASHSSAAPPADLAITQKVAVPSYINPLADPDAWARLAATPPGTVGFAVANVINGPDYLPLDEWSGVTQAVSASGVGVVGYVDTGYLGTTGQRTRLGSTDPIDWMSQIQHDIASWYKFYGTSLSGIFFDQAQNACGPTATSNEWADLYSQLTDDVERLHPGAQTVLNPGTNVPQCYENAADVIVTFEGSYQSYIDDPAAPNPYTPLTWTPTDPMKIWHIVYGAPDTASMEQAVALSKTRDAGYVYVTDDVLANPYDTLPPPDYWAAELASTPGLPEIERTPAQPRGLDTVEVYGTRVDLDWEGSHGRAQAAAYDIYRDGVLIDSVPGTSTTYSAVDLTPLTTYEFTVVARDVWDRTSPASRPLTVETDETYGDPRRPVTDLAAATTTYTSATLTWLPAPERLRRYRPDVASTLVLQNGREILRLPGEVTSVTVGGLAPGSTYDFSVVTVDETGERSVESTPLSVTTIALPSSATIGQTSITETPDQFAYSAEFLVPVAFRRVFIATGNPADPCWSTGSDPQICADYMIENERLLKYTGDGGNFDWAAIRDVVPTVDGVAYTWTISPADIGSPTTATAVFNSNGYAPNAYCGVGFACVSTGLPLPYE